MSPACGSCAERGKAHADSGALLAGRREGARSSGMTREALSTGAACAGGPARSSDEASAGRGGGGAKGPGHLWLCSFDQPSPRAVGGVA